MLNRHKTAKAQRNYTPAELKSMKVDADSGMGIGDISTKYNRTIKALEMKFYKHGIKANK